MDAVWTSDYQNEKEKGRKKELSVYHPYLSGRLPTLNTRGKVYNV